MSGTEDAAAAGWPETTGYYGKLPLAGDFLTRRAPTAFVEPWHGFVEAGLNAARDRDDFREAWLSGPIWRFAIEAGAGLDAPAAGVLMPSADKVGRLFPFTLVAPAPEGFDPFLLSALADRWFVHAENTCLKLLDLEGPDHIDPALAGLDAHAASAEGLSRREGSFEKAEDGFVGVLADPPRSGGAARAAALAARARWATDTGDAPLALFWTLGAEATPLTFLWLRGLPGPARFAAMFTGEGPGGDDGV